ncbi:starch-binding protein [Bacteroidia bacterium]|nr:starch-binding protein [Bacteroidia bacterium]
MKNNIINILLLFVCMFTIVSCEDFLNTESKSNFTEETAFNNLDYATKAVLAITNNLMFTETYEAYMAYFYAMDNDIEFRSGTDDTNAANLFCRYQADDNNMYLEGTWTRLYTSVERANVCIDNLPKSPIWEGEYADEARRLYGEALTLRALCYLNLIWHWGDVPFSVKSVQNGDNYFLPRTDRDEIYEYLIADLDEAQKYVPWLRDMGTAERVTKGYVKGLRARMALAYAGYSSRTPTETRRGRHWQEYYEIARKECREVMESGKHALNPNFATIFKTMHEYKQELQYGEVLYELPYGRLKSGRVCIYVGMAHTSTDFRWGMSSAWVNTSPYYFYSFDTKDLRRNVSCELFNYNSGGANAGLQRMNTAWINTFRPTKWRKSWINPSMGGDLMGNAFTGVNWPLMRYADIVLMFAEAENELSGPTQAAKDALASIRKRAFDPSLWDTKVTRYVDSVAVGKADFFNAIVDERAWEFGGEMVRKYDLIRWNLLGAKLTQAREGNLKIINNAPEYQHVPDQIYWKYSDDGYTIDIYNPDFRVPNASSTTIPGYTRNAWMSNKLTEVSGTLTYPQYCTKMGLGFDPAKNNHLYPIAATVIIRSNGSLNNDMLP